MFLFKFEETKNMFFKPGNEPKKCGLKKNKKKTYESLKNRTTSDAGILNAYFAILIFFFFKNEILIFVPDF